MITNRRLRRQVTLGIADENVFAGDHIAYFYETDGWDTDALLASGRLSVVRPEATCEETVTAVSAHFQRVLDAGAHDHARGVRGAPRDAAPELYP